MNRVVYELEIKVWQDKDGSATIRSEPIYGQPMIHSLTKMEWEFVKAILDTLVDPGHPIPEIIKITERTQ